MNTDGPVMIAWDPLAAAWRVAGGRAGPAGIAEVQLGGVSWRFDWVDPGLLVEALVLVPGDSPGAPVPAAAIEAVASVCGDGVARQLAGMPGTDAVATVTLDPGRAPNRSTAGRLAMALELVEQHDAPGWWDVEAAAALVALAPTAADGVLFDELVERAVELLDAVPVDLLVALDAADLAGPLAGVLSRAGVPDAELPAPLRLSSDEVDRRFGQLTELLDRAPVTLRGFPSPTFRRSSNADETRRHPVEWIEVPVHELRDAWWHREDEVVTVTLRSDGPLPATSVRLVDARGRAPVVLDSATPVAAGTTDGVTTSHCRLQGPGGSAPVRVELVAAAGDGAVAVPMRAPRHATALARRAAHLERQADAEARSGSARAVDAARDAARQWSAAHGAWEGAGAADLAASCAAHVRRLTALVEGDPTDRSGVDRDEGARCVAGWAETARVVALDHLARSSAVLSSTDPAQLSAAAAIAESVGDLGAAAGFRAQQARRSDGAARAALTRLLRRQHELLGTRAPRDLDAAGASGG